MDHSKWTVQDATELYGIARWSEGYFRINASGQVCACPDPVRAPHQTIDFVELIDQIETRGLQLPVLVRFNGILKHKLQSIHDCFAKAISDYGYTGSYRSVFPIKVNQQSEVVRQVINHGREFRGGVEAGSKAELAAVIAMSSPDIMPDLGGIPDSKEPNSRDPSDPARACETEIPIICNGFKDAEYIRLALTAMQLGRTVIPVVEKTSELDLILKHAPDYGVRPTFGIRVKLATRGSGRWQASGGYRSKFGLTVGEILASLDRLTELGMQDCFQLLHFHVGSQIGSIRHLIAAFQEAARIYVDLHQRGAGLKYLDVGGGLGVDYDGSQTDTQSSMDYSLQEYANDVVSHVQNVCDEGNVPHPELISESGRAIAATHSVLIVETIGVASQERLLDPYDDQSEQSPVAEFDQDSVSHFEAPVRQLWETLDELKTDNLRESFHDAQVSLDMCISLFGGGYLPLEQRVAAESLYFTICARIRELSKQYEHLPKELKQLSGLLSDTYFANFSLFQSLPDSWAIDQLFPVMPIQRLAEAPTRHAVLGDITCDSDGKVDRFRSGGELTSTLRLHPLREKQPYRLAVFLVGAYQETLGDLHNLFGDTHAVHVDVDESGGDTAFTLSCTVQGDTVRDVLSYLQYDENEVRERFLRSIENARAGGLTDIQAEAAAKCFQDMLDGYTYLQNQS